MEVFGYSVASRSEDWAREPAPLDATRIIVGLFLVVLGSGLAFVAFFDIYEDVILGDKSLLFNVGENALPLVFHGSIVAVGVWLLRGDVDEAHVQSIGQWFGAAIVAVVVLGLWIYIFQVLQDSIKPLFVFAHLLGAAGAAGIGIGLYDAAQTTRERELEQYEEIIGSVGDQVYVLDSQGRFAFVNEQFATFADSSFEELIGEDVGAVFEDASKIRVANEKIAAGESEQETIEASVSTAERTIPCETDLSFLPGGTGAVVGVVRDISHREAVEAELESERNRLSILYQSIPDPIAETELVESAELDAELLSVNDAFEREFDCTTSSVRGETIGTIVRQSDGQGIAPRSPESWETEISCRTADGIRTFLLRMIPFEMDNRREAYWLFTDITEQTMRRRRLQVLNRVMRHNLRNDMTVIINSAQLLEEHEDPEVAETAARITSTSSEIVEMGNRLKEIDEMVESSTRHEPRQLTDVVKRALDEANEDGIDTETITVDIDEEYTVRADGILETAVAELIENAFQYSDREEPAVGITADPFDEQWLELRVLDDGPGIPDHERIPFKEGDVTQLEHASGIGLWMVSWIVSSLGGEIDVEDNLPRGTVVTLRLPRS